MNTVEKLEQLIEIARTLGYRVRYDYFGGTGGGVCEFSGNKWLFVDLALSTADQLDRLEKLIAQEPLLSRIHPMHLTPQHASERVA